MAIYAIGDLHLSLGANKSMEIFGAAWENYVPRIEQALSELSEQDVLILAGDTSWGMSLQEAEADFRFLERFPVRKYLVKGNHDYWWTTTGKFQRFCQEKNFQTLSLLHNNCCIYQDYALCGTRGWFLEPDKARNPNLNFNINAQAQIAQNQKVLRREVIRLETSLQAAQAVGPRPIICFLHYPPIYQGYTCPEILDILDRYAVCECCYGHLHGPVITRRFEGKRHKTIYSLISADYLDFTPKRIRET